PRPDEALAVEVRSPLTDMAAAKKPIVDLSANGFSFILDGARDLYPLGLRVEATLRLPDGPLACARVVRTLTREGGRLRWGVELGGLDEAAHLRLANFVMRLRFPSVDDGGSLTCDELFDFFRATGFLHPAKEEVLAPVMSEVRAALTAVYAQPSR